MALPTFFTAPPTVVYTAVLWPGAPAMPDLARLAFGAVLWVVLIVVNRGASHGSTKRSSTEAEHQGVRPGGDKHKNRARKGRLRGDVEAGGWSGAVRDGLAALQNRNDRPVPRPVVVVPGGRRSDTMPAPRFLVIPIALGGFLTGGVAMTVKAATKTPKPITVKVNLIDAKGIGKSIGTVTIKETADGLEFDTNLKGLPPGEHGFHVHEKGSCAVADKDGTPTAGQAAAGHYDPEGTNAHKGPGGGGHKGDLPKLEVDAKGNANVKLKAPGLKLADVRGRALMIHEGGDNYSDTPKPLGGGGARIACGVIPPQTSAAKEKAAN